jgi:ATP-dependent RNA helicase SUPV3L1/SUV3
MNLRPARGRVVAVLGPTNTGKTHLALERLLGHRTGMIGFPLRLLARENYDRIVRLKGKGAVALLTGEEKIVPPHPQWFVCTVESMPVDRVVDFLAVDEIQLCADADRGHVFTDRLLHARGEAETMFLGAETIKPLIRRLVPDVEFISRPRFSQLTYAGPQKLNRLPPRSCVVAFSAADVYALAELVRRQRGGAAVVLGALSPRTRNAQVALYQAGEVDYLVSTDAIGMGLNMDVDHVAFAALRKFDGRAPRALEAAELAQIAGRAGRHMNDGTFGTTDDVGPLDPTVVNAVENHAFPMLKRLQWRNGDLRFTSLDILLASLARQPEIPGLIRAREADDVRALQALASDEEIVGRSQSVARVHLLWDVCQIPDFRKSLAEQHSRLLAAIYRHLTGAHERLPADWLDAQVKRIDRTDGDIDSLITRIANIRTWTYVSHHADWVGDAVHWQERTRAIEDRLSDALHERLTKRFVDRRTAILVKRLKESADLVSAVSADGEVEIEGHFVGRLQGFHFQADRAEGLHATRAVAAAAQRALKDEIAQRVNRLAHESDDAFALDDQGFILWREVPVARLAAGRAVLRPTVELLPSDLVEVVARSALDRRLKTWLASFLADALAPLAAAPDTELSGAARGLVYQLDEALGSLPRRSAEAQVASLTDDDRKALARRGVRLGVESVFLPALLKPAAQRLRALLWTTHSGRAPSAGPPAGRVVVSIEPGVPAEFYEAIGCRPLGGLAVRVDMLERFAAMARKLARQGPFTMSAALSSVLGINPDGAGQVLEALGFQARQSQFGLTYSGSRRHPRPQATHRRAGGREASPFAALRRRIPA